MSRKITGITCRIGRLSTDTEQLVAHADRPLARIMDG